MCVCVFTPQSLPLPKPVLQRVRASVSCFSFQYPLFSTRSSTSCLRLFLCLPVTSVPPFIFPSIMCFRRQWPIQSAFLLFILCVIFLSSLTLCNTSSFLTRSFQLIFSILLQHHILKLSRCFWPTFRSVQVSAPYNSNCYGVTSYRYVFNQSRFTYFPSNRTVWMAVSSFIRHIYCDMFRPVITAIIS